MQLGLKKYIKQVLFFQLLSLGVSESVEEISEIYVSEFNGYFIGDDVKNALEVTNEFIAQKFNTTQIVSLLFITKFSKLINL